MNRVRKTGILVALVVLGVCVVGAFMTRGAMQHLSFLNGTGGSGTRAAKGGWWTSGRGRRRRALAALAVSAEEENFAREAQRLADHEVDQAFAQALRQASAESRQLKGTALELQQRVTELQQTVKDDHGAGGGVDG